MRLVSVFLAALSVSGLVAGTARSESTGFTWTGEMRFDPAKPVTAAGGTLGALMSEIFGPGALSGSVPVSGRITYETGFAPDTANGKVAAYRDALTLMELKLGGIDVSADLALSRANAATSKVGFFTEPGGGFCGDYEHCQMGGVRLAGWGAAVGTLNDTPHMLVDETGPTGKMGDGFGFMAGRTDAVGEFTPGIQTAGFGVVSVDGFGLLLFSVPGGQFFNSTALPSMGLFAGSRQIGRTELWLFLEGAALADKLRIEGVVTGMQILP